MLPDLPVSAKLSGHDGNGRRVGVIESFWFQRNHGRGRRRDLNAAIHSSQSVTSDLWMKSPVRMFLIALA